MAEASSYFPAIFTLGKGPVQAIQTNDGNPQTRLDATGIFATDSNGNRVFEIDSAQGANPGSALLSGLLKLLLASTGEVSADQALEFIGTAGGVQSVLYEILATQAIGAGTQSLRIGTPTGDNLTLQHNNTTDPNKATLSIAGKLITLLDSVGNSDLAFSRPAKVGLNFQNGWRPYNGGDPAWTPVTARLDGGTCRLDGMIDKAGGSYIAEEIMATLPSSSYYPAVGQIFEVETAGGGMAGDAEVRVLPNGQITLGQRGGPANPINWLSLAGLSWATY